MPSFYDNWEKLVSAVLKKEQLWQLFHAQSRSPSLSSDSSGDSFSFRLNSSVGSVNFAEEFGPSNSPSSILVKDPSPDVPLVSRESPVQVKSVSAKETRKRSLVIQVPKLELHKQAALICTPDYYRNLSPRVKSSVNPVPTYRTNHSSPNPRVISPANHITNSRATPTTRTKCPANPVSSSRSPSPRTTSSVNHVLSPRVHTNWPDVGKQVCHPLPLPPEAVSKYANFSQPHLHATSPSVPCSPGRAENTTSPVTSWKKGKLLDSGKFGYVYLGFNSQTGKMCAIKEVILLPDDGKLKKCTKKLEQEIAILSSLKHPNVVQIYGSETVEDKLYIYFEFVSAGTLRNILEKYGKLGESAIRRYTKQILSGLVYLHSKNTAHRDINGANVLVEPNGSVKLGIAKHIIKEFDPLQFDGSPYWTAPEVVRNSNVCEVRADIWSLGCVVLEMATSKPPWSQYEGAVMFKIAHNKELPVIPDYLSEEGKEFVRLCLQRNPLHRPTAAQLLEHPFVKSAATKQVLAPAYSDARNFYQLDSDRLAVHSYGVSQTNIHSRSHQHLNRRFSPPPVSSLNTRSSISPTTQTGGKSPPGPNCSNSPSYWDPDIMQGRILKLP